jgi:hypothetical protein
MSDIDARLRASIAARMLMPPEERPDPEALKRLEGHLLALRQRIEDDAHADHDQEGR